MVKKKRIQVFGKKKDGVEKTDRQSSIRVKLVVIPLILILLVIAGIGGIFVFFKGKST